MAKRLMREKLTVTQSASVEAVAPSRNWEVDLQDEGAVDAFFLRALEEGREILRQLNIYLRKYGKKRVVANTILGYLRHVSAANAAVGPQSLRDYKKHIDEDQNIALNSKYQKYNHARAFVRALMAADVIQAAELPPSFAHETPIPKSAFSRYVWAQLPAIAGEWPAEVSEVQKRHNMDAVSAQTLIFCTKAMSALQAEALADLRAYQKDAAFVDKSIAGATDAELSHLKTIENFSFLGDSRGLTTAFRILYARYGRILPVAEHWPIGLSDFLKYRNWGSSRVRSAYFPTAKSLEGLLVAALSHSELCPNVDSVAFYTYLDSFKPAFEKDAIHVHMGKKRGQPVDVVLPADDAVVMGFMFHIERMKRLLAVVPGGAEFLAREFTPVMLHCTGAAGRPIKVTELDPTTPGNMVRRFVKKAAKTQPILAHLEQISGQNFRPTHALIMNLSGKATHRIKTQMHHRHLSTTRGYLDRVETESSLKVRHSEFQAYLVQEARAEKRTGSGYICGERTLEETACGDYGACFSCEARRVVFSSAEIVAEWIAWETKIRENEQTLKFRNPLRWREYWEVKMIEYQVLLSKVAPQLRANAAAVAKDLHIPPLD